MSFSYMLPVQRLLLSFRAVHAKDSGPGQVQIFFAHMRLSVGEPRMGGMFCVTSAADRHALKKGFRAIMSHHDASSSDQHFPGICWMLTNKRAGKHN